MSFACDKTDEKGSADQEKPKGTNYYFDFEEGNDDNSGIDKSSPFKTFSIISNLVLEAGDSILLKGGQTHLGSLKLSGVNGTSFADIVISSYGKGNATIDAKGHLAGVELYDCGFITVSDLSITADGYYTEIADDARVAKLKMRCGVFIGAKTKSLSRNITIKDLKIADIYAENKGFDRPNEDVTTSNGEGNYGYGIRIYNSEVEGAIMSDFVIDNCDITRVSHTGIKSTSDASNEIKRLLITDCEVSYVGGPGMQFSRTDDSEVRRNTINYSGAPGESRNWSRGSGLWTWGCDKMLIEHNKFMNANGPADSAGAHIDFNCTDVIIQYNFSYNNAGGFCEILGNNYNCAYRYNVSVGDGYRVKGQKYHGVKATQEGKVYWLSGYVGKNQKKHGPYNSYCYNNTIYTSPEMVAKIAIEGTAQGLLVMNNIFCIDSEFKSVLGDQYNPEQEGEGTVINPIFKNNLFLKENWPANAPVRDQSPLYGDPQFKNPGGVNIEDYIPQNIAIIKDKGLPIQLIPGDTKGLQWGGLVMNKDILGRQIDDKPDMGAIEIK